MYVKDLLEQKQHGDGCSCNIFVGRVVFRRFTDGTKGISLQGIVPDFGKLCISVWRKKGPQCKPFDKSFCEAVQFVYDLESPPRTSRELKGHLFLTEHLP